MCAKSGNALLTKAKSAKKDEFYTQLCDIEREVVHYREHFRGKTVLCNCDDPRVSNFFHYFSYNFEFLGLKKLISICYKNQNRDLFSTKSTERAIWLEYNGDKNGNRVPDPEEIGIHYLEGDGDFRKEDSIKLLAQSDIVVTNPPFSLFREFVAQLVKYEKKFLIIGNVNAVKYKEIFPLIKDGKLWLGCSIHSGDREFGVPEGYPLEAASCRVDEHGKKYIRVKGVRWFTNLDYCERHEDMILFRKYDPELYPKYENYDAIEVGKTADIPCDYDGVMGVLAQGVGHSAPKRRRTTARGAAGFAPTFRGMSAGWARLDGGERAMSRRTAFATPTSCPAANWPSPTDVASPGKPCPGCG